MRDKKNERLTFEIKLIHEKTVGYVGKWPQDISVQYIENGPFDHEMLWQYNNRRGGKIVMIKMDF